MWHYEDEEADCTGSTDEQVAVSRPSQSPEERIAMWHYEDEESDGSTDEQFLHDFEDCERCMDYMDYIELQEYTAFKAFRRFSQKRAMYERTRQPLKKRAMYERTCQPLLGRTGIMRREPGVTTQPADQATTATGGRMCDSMKLHSAAATKAWPADQATTATGGRMCDSMKLHSAAVTVNRPVGKETAAPNTGETTDDGCDSPILYVAGVATQRAVPCSDSRPGTGSNASVVSPASPLSSTPRDGSGFNRWQRGQSPDARWQQGQSLAAVSVDDGRVGWSDSPTLVVSTQDAADPGREVSSGLAADPDAFDSQGRRFHRPALEATNIMRLLDFAWFRAECDHALRTRLDRHSRDCFDLVSKYLLALKARLAVWSC